MTLSYIISDCLGKPYNLVIRTRLKKTDSNLSEPNKQTSHHLFTDLIYLIVIMHDIDTRDMCDYVIYRQQWSKRYIQLECRHKSSKQGDVGREHAEWGKVGRQLWNRVVKWTKLGPRSPLPARVIESNEVFYIRRKMSKLKTYSQLCIVYFGEWHLHRLQVWSAPYQPDRLGFQPCWTRVSVNHKWCTS